MAEYDPNNATAMGDEREEDFVQNGEQTEFAQSADDEEDDDYDPSSFNFGDSAAQTPSANADFEMPADAVVPASFDDVKSENEQGNVTKALPKTVGGFIVEDDDDEEEDETNGGTQNATPVPSQAMDSTGVQSGHGAKAVSEAQDITLASAPTTDTAAIPANSGTSLNGSTATAVPVPDHSVSVSQSSLSLPQADQGNVRQAISSTPQPEVKPESTQQLPNGASSAAPSAAVRLPHDKVGRLEDRIKEDPKADTEAWYALLDHYKEKDQTDNVRKTYDRMLEVFPTSATLWTAYIDLELSTVNRAKIDLLLSKALVEEQGIDLWRAYLSYIRRFLPLTNDPNGLMRNTLTQAFEKVLDTVGIDPEAGDLWSEYIEFISSGPGSIGGAGWQDAQKMDLLRKTYQRAIRLPHSELTRLWKDYDRFEMSLNKAGGRKALQEQSPHYMTARSAHMAMGQYLTGLDRKSLPVLPPVNGFRGDDEFAFQVEHWHGWIELEKTDPLVLKGEDIAAFHKRILYVYHQATMALRFYPRIWFEAAQWCFEQYSDELNAAGEKFLDAGLKANPESVLLALKKADRIEIGLSSGGGDEVAIANGEKLDVPYENVLKSLYALREKMMQRDKRILADIQVKFAGLPAETNNVQNDNVDDDEAANKPQTPAEQKQAQIQAIETAAKAQLDLLKRTISYVWVAKMRAFRRIQGQGAPGHAKKGFRGVFAECRPRGQIGSNVYIASALIEWHCYKDGAAMKIFERGMKLFPTDEIFAQEYIKHLISINDVTNARVVFETTITRILNAKTPNTTDEQKKQRLRPFLAYMHNFESSYGDLSQIHKLEKRMAEMFPDEPELVRFSHRFSGFPPSTFDGIDVELIISPNQARPKMFIPPNAAPYGQAVVPVAEAPIIDNNIRLGPNGPYVASPKRPLDDSDSESPARKFIRGNSPLAGAAGRRMANNAAAMAGAALGSGGFAAKSMVPGASYPDSGPATFEGGVQLLPKAVYEFLRKLPPAREYNMTVFDPARTVEWLRNFDLQTARAHAGR